MNANSKNTYLLPGEDTLDEATVLVDFMFL